MRALIVPLLCLGLILASAIGLTPQKASALIYADPSLEPLEVAPPDFPFWENVTQRRYEGPTVIYLGGGWAMTARHVGRGEILLRDAIIRPHSSSRHTLRNVDGSSADAMLFQLDESEPIPRLPMIPIASHAPIPGEEVLVIGFGRTSEERIQLSTMPRDMISYSWSERGEKHWGTNRVEQPSEWVRHLNFLTTSFK